MCTRARVNGCDARIAASIADKEGASDQYRRLNFVSAQAILSFYTIVIGAANLSINVIATAFLFDITCVMQRRLQNWRFNSPKLQRV